MNNLGISVLPHVVNALLVTGIFSAGNSHAYSTSRVLYGLACDGLVPELFKKCTKAGAPIYAFGATMLYSSLAFLQLSKSSSTIYNMYVKASTGLIKSELKGLAYYSIIDVTTAGGLIDFITMTSTYIFFYQACQVQGLDRRILPYRGYGQSCLAYIALVALIVIIFSFSYMSFWLWDVNDFFSYYTLLLLAPITFTDWKAIERTQDCQSPLS